MIALKAALGHFFMVKYAKIVPMLGMSGLCEYLTLVSVPASVGG